MFEFKLRSLTALVSTIWNISERRNSWETGALRGNLTICFPFNLIAVYEKKTEIINRSHLWFFFPILSLQVSSVFQSAIQAGLPMCLTMHECICACVLASALWTAKLVILWVFTSCCTSWCCVALLLAPSQISIARSMEHRSLTLYLWSPSCSRVRCQVTHSEF